MRQRIFLRAKERKTRRGGFTLIEIMIALVIFVFGALAIVRIFPSGLGIVRDTEDSAIATRMSRTTVTGQESKANLSAEAIYKADAAGNWLEPLSTVAPTVGNPLTYTGSRNSGSIPQGPQDNILSTTLGELRHIRGERHIVQGSSSNSYVLTRFPYVSVSAFREEKVIGAKIRSDGHVDFRGARFESSGLPVEDTSFATSGNATIPATNPALPPYYTNLRDISTFYVSYRWTADPASSGSARVQGEIDEPLLMSDNNTAWDYSQDGRVAVSLLPIPSPVIPGSVDVRVRTPLSAITTTAAPPGFADNIVGLVRLSSTGLTPGQSVTLDYDVINWQALVHDEVPSIPAIPPAANQWSINTPMRGIDPELGLTTLFISPGASPQFEWAALTPSGGFVQSAVGGTPKLIDIAGSAGLITCETPNNTQTRTVYRTLDGWTQQVGIAARSYIPFIANRTTVVPNSPREGWREYVWLSGGANGGKLYFQPSEAGKVVMVTYEYNDAGGVPHLISNAMVPLGEELENTAMPSGFASNQVAVAQLNDLQGNALGANLIAVRSVQGVSTMARTAWIKGQRYSQVIAKGMRPLVQ